MSRPEQRKHHALVRLDIGEVFRPPSLIAHHERLFQVFGSALVELTTGLSIT
jgi:hypothetical protein